MDKARDNKLIRLLDSILDASPESVQMLFCPFCNGGLSIQFINVQPVRASSFKTRKRMSLHVQCKECPWDSIADGLPYQPPWVRKLGPKIRTTGAIVDGRTVSQKLSVPRTKVPLK
jgi:hypothetical protein